MENNVAKNIKEIKSILTKMSLSVCCVLALPEFGLRWSDVKRGVHKAKLRMEPAGVAKFLCRYAQNALLPRDLDELVKNLRLKLVTTRKRTWHVIKLNGRDDERVSVLKPDLSMILKQELKTLRSINLRKPEVRAIQMDTVVYISIEMQGATPMFMALPIQEDVALVSSKRSGVIGVLVKGLGYDTFEDVSLNGQDIDSLLRIYNSGNTNRAEHLSGLPEYYPVPVITKSSIDYTNKAYDQLYVQQVIGPNPPVLTSLVIKSEKQYFNPHLLNKKMKVQMELKTQDVAKTLTNWVKINVISPTSEMLHIYHKIKSNNYVYNNDSD